MSADPLDQVAIDLILQEERLRKVLQRRDQINRELESMDIDPSQREILGRESSYIIPLARTIEEYMYNQRAQKEAQSMLYDQESDVRLMAQTELQDVNERIAALQKDIILRLLPSDERDMSGIILEVRSGTGGIEAGLFAADLYRMYLRFSAIKNWKTQQIDINEDANGAIKRVVAQIDGEGVFSRLKFESGVHRVQRVPTTEASGRIHTSAASVVILAKPRQIDVKIDNKDLRIDTYRAQGAGGQHVNKTDSAVRITHQPTGIVVQCQDDKSQHRNRDRAMQELRARLYDYQHQQEESQRSESRRSMIGSGDRSERIRTYNFPQGRITDHRIGLTIHKLEQVMSGEGLDVLTDALQSADEARRLESALEQGDTAFQTFGSNNSTESP